MTGDSNLDQAIIAVAAFALGFVGKTFGWTFMVRMADWIKSLEDKPKPAPAEPMADTKEFPKEIL